MDSSSTTRILGHRALQELHTWQWTSTGRQLHFYQNQEKNVFVGATTILLHEHAPGAKGYFIGECYLRVQPKRKKPF